MAVFLDQLLWIEVPRRRVFIWGMSSDLGHAVAADWMYHQVMAVMKYRKLGPPTPVQAIADPDCPLERVRRDVVKDCV